MELIKLLVAIPCLVVLVWLGGEFLKHDKKLVNSLRTIEARRIERTVAEEG